MANKNGLHPLIREYNKPSEEQRNNFGVIEDTETTIEFCKNHDFESCDENHYSSEEHIPSDDEGNIITIPVGINKRNIEDEPDNWTDTGSETEDANDKNDRGHNKDAKNDRNGNRGDNHDDDNSKFDDENRVNEDDQFHSDEEDIQAYQRHGGSRGGSQRGHHSSRGSGHRGGRGRGGGGHGHHSGGGHGPHSGGHHGLHLTKVFMPTGRLASIAVPRVGRPCSQKCVGTDGFHAIMRKKTASLLGRTRGSTNTILKAIVDKFDCPILAHWVKLVNREQLKGWKCGRPTKLINLDPHGKNGRREFKLVSKVVQLTKRQHSSGHFDHYRFVKIEKVVNGCFWKRYRARQSEIHAEAKFVNERMLFHGTNKVNDLLKSGFDERYANINGMFGAGIYFAKHSSKSNQYAFGLNQPCPVHKDKNCDKCERQMLLCRVTMGKIKKETGAAKVAHAPPGHHSVEGVVTPGGLQFPEYIVYRGEQVYPEYLITYKIVK